MEKTLIILTFIPWLCYYVTYCNIAIQELKKKKFNYKYFKENYFRLFRLETLLLMSIFIYFTKYDNNIVNMMLFGVINLFLFINLFYDNRYQNKKIIKKIDFYFILPLIIISLIPFTIYFINQNLTFLYYCLFSYVFLAYLVVCLSYLIANLVKKVFKR